MNSTYPLRCFSQKITNHEENVNENANKSIDLSIQALGKSMQKETKKKRCGRRSLILDMRVIFEPSDDLEESIATTIYHMRRLGGNGGEGARRGRRSVGRGGAPKQRKGGK